MRKLLALHGQTLNGTFMRRELARLEKVGVELVCPDGPNARAEGTVDRLYAVWDQPRQEPPHCSWGEHDHLVADNSRALVDRFDAAARQVVTWSGGHAIPSHGPAATALEQFIVKP